MSEIAELEAKAKAHPRIALVVGGVCVLIFVVIVFGKKSTTTSTDTPVTVGTSSSTDNSALAQIQSALEADQIQAGVSENANDDALAATKAQYQSATDIQKDEDATSVTINGQNVGLATTKDNNATNLALTQSNNAANVSITQSNNATKLGIQQAADSAAVANYAQDTIRQNNGYEFDIASGQLSLAQQTEKDTAANTSAAQSDAFQLGMAQNATTAAQNNANNTLAAQAEKDSAYNQQLATIADGKHDWYAGQFMLNHPEG